MRSFFDSTASADLHQRIRNLNAETRQQWGRMNAAQMLAHCRAPMEVALGELQLKKNFFSLFGWMLKRSIISDKPFSKNSPTAREYRIVDNRDFEQERKRFDETFVKLASGPEAVKCFDHPFFGKMTTEDWGQLLYKHLDHHLTQFGL